MMNLCKVCGSIDSKYFCQILQKHICTNCCNHFQLCKLDKWDQLLEEDVDIDKLSEKCLNCKGLTRNNNEEIEIKGFYSITTFTYNGKYVFSNSHGDLINKKRIVLLEGFKDDLNAKYYMAESLYEIGKSEEAIELLRYTQIQSDSIDVQILLGKAYMSLRDYNNSELHFKNALKNDSNNALIYRQLGDVCQYKGDYISSIYYYQQSLNNFDLDENGQINDVFNNMNNIGLAVSYSKLEKYEKVIEYSNQYLEQELDWEYLEIRVKEQREGKVNYMNIDYDIFAFSTLYHLMSISYLELNNLDLALKYIDRAVELNKKDVSFAKIQGIIIGRKHGQGEIVKYEEDIKMLKAYAELRASSLTALKSFTPDEQVILYTGNQDDNVKNFLVKQIFSSLRSILPLTSHITPSLEQAADEDKYTDLFRANMKWLNEVFGWTTHTQDRGGFTRYVFGVRGGIGERDFVIKSQEDKDLMIGEALILKGLDTTVIKTHTEKPFGYDIQSANFQIIIIWGFSKTPDNLWGEYKKIVLSRTKGYFSLTKSGEVEELIPDIDKQALRTFYTIHSTDQEYTEATVIHVYVDIYNEMKRRISEASRRK